MVALTIIGAVLVAAWLTSVAVYRLRVGSDVKVRHHEAILVPQTRDTVSTWLLDIHNLPVYEVKVQRVTATSPDATGARTYSPRGWFLGIPWWGVFSLKPTPDGGFHSEMVRGPFRGVVSGGFRVTDTTEGTRITHYEAYRLSALVPFIVLARPLLARWLAWSMRVEMQAIRTALADAGASAVASEDTLPHSETSWQTPPPSIG